MKKVQSKGYKKLSQFTEFGEPIRLPNKGDKHMDHGSYPERLKSKTDDELRYIIQDARAAMEANPDNLNNGYYADEINYAGMELKRRQSQKGMI